MTSAMHAFGRKRGPETFDKLTQPSDEKRDTHHGSRVSSGACQNSRRSLGLHVSVFRNAGVFCFTGAGMSNSIVTGFGCGRPGKPKPQPWAGLDIAETSGFSHGPVRRMIAMGRSGPCLKFKDLAMDRSGPWLKLEVLAMGRSGP
jgi:hypothetical protein